MGWAGDGDGYGLRSEWEGDISGISNTTINHDDEDNVSFNSNNSTSNSKFSFLLFFADTLSGSKL